VAYRLRESRHTDLGFVKANAFRFVGTARGLALELGVHVARVGITVNEQYERHAAAFLRRCSVYPLFDDVSAVSRREEERPESG
jgi:hypothetical protein